MKIQLLCYFISLIYCQSQYKEIQAQINPKITKNIREINQNYLLKSNFPVNVVSNSQNVYIKKYIETAKIPITDSYSTVPSINQNDEVTKDLRIKGQQTFFDDYYRTYGQMLNNIDLNRKYNFDDNYSITDLKKILPLYLSQKYDESMYNIYDFHFDVTNQVKDAVKCECRKDLIQCQCPNNDKPIILPTVIPAITSNYGVGVEKNDKLYNMSEVNDEQAEKSLAENIIVKVDEKLINNSENFQKFNQTQKINIQKTNTQSSIHPKIRDQQLNQQQEQLKIEEQEQQKQFNTQAQQNQNKINNIDNQTSTQTQQSQMEQKILKKQQDMIDEYQNLQKQKDSFISQLEQLQKQQEKLENLENYQKKNVQQKNIKHSKEFIKTHEQKIKNKNLRFKQVVDSVNQNQQQYLTLQRNLKDLQEKYSPTKQELSLNQKILTMQNEKTFTNPSVKANGYIQGQANIDKYISDLFDSESSVKPIILNVLVIKNPHSLDVKSYEERFKQVIPKIIKNKFKKNRKNSK